MTYFLWLRHPLEPAIFVTLLVTVQTEFFSLEERREIVRLLFGAAFAALVGLGRVLRYFSEGKSRLKLGEVLGEIILAFSAGFVVGALVHGFGWKLITVYLWQGAAGFSNYLVFTLTGKGIIEILTRKGG